MTTMTLTHDPRLIWLARHRVVILLAILAALGRAPASAQTRFSFKTNDYGAAAAIAFSPDSRLLALAADGADILLFDLAEGRDVVAFNHVAGVKASVSVGHLAFSPDSRTLAVGFGGDPRDRQIVFFDIAKRAARGSIALGEGLPEYFAFSTDGSRLAARVLVTGRAQASEVRVWDSDELRLVKSLDASPYATTGTTIAFSADGKWLATAHGRSDAKGQVILWDAATLERRFTLRAGGGRLELAFSPDSRLIAAGVNHRW